MIISITKLQLKSFWYLFDFFSHAHRSVDQVKSAAGLKHFDLKNNLGKLTFYTLTAWENETQMRSFMLSGYHKQAMKVTQNMAKKAISTHFESDKIPNWEEALKILQQNTEKTY